MNNTPLTAGEIAEITERCEAATSGKWTYDGMAYIWSSECSSDGYMIAEIRGTGYLTGKCGLSDDDANKIEDDNAEFIAHARTDLPRALATIAQQGAELDRLREEERWIPVGEGLPKASGVYWVNLHQEDEDGNDADFCIEAWYQVNHLLFAPKEVGWKLLNEWYEFSEQMRQYISHWQQLPQPPEAKGEK